MWTASLSACRYPELNQERRQEIVKIARKYTEQARVLRNVRKDGMDQTKKLEKDGKISEDESGKLHTKVQNMTDKTIKEIDALFASKELEISQV